jgi:hypothetical protein
MSGSTAFDAGRFSPFSDELSSKGGFSTIVSNQENEKDDNGDFPN